MKVKKYLSVLAVACAGALTLAGCSDYDNGYNENAIKFQESFKETFGDIDPEQDWNLAERATVTVNTQTESNIKIYALRGSEYTLVGDYKGVNGTQMLGVDVIEGTRNLLVSDGRTAQKCIPGDVVVFNSMSTRTTHETTGGFIEVTKLWGPVDDLGDGKTYQMYRYSTEAEAKQAVDTQTGIVAQGKVNLQRVINNFSYVSNGPFIIYPYYWYTGSTNTVGVYYYDSQKKIQKVPIYTIKGHNENEDPELYYENITYSDKTRIYSDANELSSNGQWPTGWNVDNGVTTSNFKINTTDKNSSDAGMTQPFIEYWFPASQNQVLKSGTLTRKFTGLQPGVRYRVQIDARLWNGNKNGGPSGVEFFVGNTDNKKDLAANKTVTEYEGTPFVSGTYSLEYEADANGELVIGFKIANAPLANWLTFKNLQIWEMEKHKDWASTDNKESFGIITCGQGIKVNIPQGTQFGMYLFSDNGTDTITYYSEAELNRPESRYGKGMKYNGSGPITSKENWSEDSTLDPCYASTFNVEGQMFFGFEDWSYPTGSDMDLNDVVLAVSGLTPTVINEEPTTSTWLLACEDLGGTFDRDYNDLVFKVDYISGQTTAKVTPLAAGGTLASYIFHVPESGSEQCLGEIHQLFGFEPAVSGEYEAHNVTGTSRGTEGQTVTIEVPSDWSMAYCSTNKYSLTQGVNDEGYQNMGGFEIRTLRKGTEAIANASANWSNITALSSGASRIPAPNRGEAPYIICLPYSYIEANTPVGYDTETFWAWPREFMNIDGCYLDFPKWVSKHNTYGTWYENKKDGAPTVDDLKIQRPRASALLPSQLGHDKETIEVVKNSGNNSYYDVNNYADLYANLTGLSSGTLHYYYYMHTWNQTEADKQVLNANDHLSNEGERTIVVVQDADGTHEAGKTSFILKVSAAAVPKTDGLAYRLQVEGQGETGLQTGSYTINVNKGDYLWVYIKDLNGNENVRSGLTATFNGQTFNIGDNKNGWPHSIGFNIAAGWGVYTLTLHAPANENFTEQTINITVYVTEKVILKSTGPFTCAMAIEDGKLKTVKNYGNDNEKWYVSVFINGSGDAVPGCFTLCNVATGKYLAFNKKDRTVVLTDTRPTGGEGRLQLEDGKIHENYFWPYNNEHKWYIGIIGSLGENSEHWPTGLIDITTTPGNVITTFDMQSVN